MSSISPSSGRPGRPCVRCGAPLSLNENQCQRCGLMNPPFQGPPPAMVQQGGFPPPNRQPAPSQPLQQSLFGPPNGSPLPGPSSQPLFNNASFPMQQGTLPPSPNTFPPAGNNPPSLNGANGQVQSRWMPPPIQKPEDNDDDDGKKPGPGVILVIVALLVILIGGGTFAALYILRQNNPSNSNPTARLTIVTPTGTPLFSDTFQNNANGWDLTPPAQAKISLSGGKLLLESDNHEIFPVLLPIQKSFSNFRLDVNAGLTEGDQDNGYGIYIRAASTQDSLLGLYYRLEVYGDGTFAVYKGIESATGNTQSTVLKDDAASTAILTHDQVNHLTVIADGERITFEVNGTPLTTFTDKSYKSGSIALFVSNVSGVAAGTQAAFSNLAIFPA